MWHLSKDLRKEGNEPHRYLGERGQGGCLVCQGQSGWYQVNEWESVRVEVRRETDIQIHSLKDYCKDWNPLEGFEQSSDIFDWGFSKITFIKRMYVWRSWCIKHFAWTHINTWKMWDENLSFLTCLIGEGNGTPLQYSCLENPMDGGAW